MGTENRQSKRIGGRPLVLLFLFLALSGGLRLVVLGSAAMAADGAEDADHAQVTNATVAPTPVLSELLEDLRLRSIELDAREAAVEGREALLKEAETALQHDLSVVEAAEARLQSAIDVAETAAADDLGKLIAVYENMKPADAAALFEAMTPEFAAGFLSEMRAEAAASILSDVAPEFAYAISVIIAGRNADIVLE